MLWNRSWPAVSQKSATRTQLCLPNGAMEQGDPYMCQAFPCRFLCRTMSVSWDVHMQWYVEEENQREGQYR